MTPPMTNDLIAQLLIEALADRVRELEGALDAADDALRSYACCGLGSACIRSPDQCRADCGQPAGLALDAIASVRQARKAKENATDSNR